ncbi:MAG: VUT family protein [Deltaproteobacteria bacterium]|jgi:uncharacterized PurR-regulated membrane protein YhhQ (DUF165 family)|nr:VUT family protein [Deltaproteobacteria bacterium]
MRYALLYIATIVLVNCAFSEVPVFLLPGGEAWSPVALVVGFIFVIRDYAQREIGHKVLLAMLAGGGISWFMADPRVALASICAFLVGELLDWTVYTFTKRPFSRRVLLSSAIGTPLDSLVFMSMIGLFSIPSVIIMTASKMLGATVVFLLARQRERAQAQYEQTV